MSLVSSFFATRTTKFKYKPSLSFCKFGVLDDDNTEWETMGWKFLSLGEWHTVCSVSRVGGLEEIVKLFRQRSQTRANTEPSLIMTRIIKRTSNHSVKLQVYGAKSKSRAKMQTLTPCDSPGRSRISTVFKYWARRFLTKWTLFQRRQSSVRSILLLN